jgi:ribonuclease J
MADNGDSFLLDKEKMEYSGQVPHGSVLVDQTGNTVSNVVVKDRIMLSESGLVAVILTVDKKSGQLLTSPDIVTRGFIYIRDNEELMNKFRAELRRAVNASSALTSTVSKQKSKIMSLTSSTTKQVVRQSLSLL